MRILLIAYFTVSALIALCEIYYLIREGRDDLKWYELVLIVLFSSIFWPSIMNALFYGFGDNKKKTTTKEED